MSTHTTEGNHTAPITRQVVDYCKTHPHAINAVLWFAMISYIVLVIAGTTQSEGSSDRAGWVLAFGAPALLIGWVLYCRKRDATVAAQWQADEAERQRLLELLGDDNQLIASGLVEADKPVKRNRHWVLTGGATAVAIVIGASMLPQETPTSAPVSITTTSTSIATPKPLFDTRHITPATKTKTTTAIQTATQTVETARPEPAAVEQPPIDNTATAGVNSGDDSGSSGLTVKSGTFCSSAGSVGVSTKGKPMTCRSASDGRLRWQSA